MRKKICFVASSGGHFEQIMMLKPLMEKYDSIAVTEKTNYRVKSFTDKIYYLHQINRREKLFFLFMLLNAIKSLFIVIKERPKIIITTGVLAVIPICIWVKLLGGKLIYIESFAKVKTPTETGKLMYKFADQFYVQWEALKEYYPNAIYIGGIY